MTYEPSFIRDCAVLIITHAAFAAVVGYACFRIGAIVGAKRGIEAATRIRKWQSAQFDKWIDSRD